MHEASILGEGIESIALGHSDAKIEPSDSESLSGIPAGYQKITLQDVSLECLPEDTSLLVFDSIEMVVLGAKVLSSSTGPGEDNIVEADVSIGSGNATKLEDRVEAAAIVGTETVEIFSPILLERVSPTIWKARGVFEVYLGAKELVVVVRSGDLDLGRLTLMREEMTNLTRAELDTLCVASSPQKRKLISTTMNLPSLWLKFAYLEIPGNVSLAVKQYDLAQSFYSRFELLGNIADVSTAIEHYQKAIQLTPEGHENLPIYLRDLGTSLERRSWRTNLLSDISKAVEYQQKALQSISESHTEMPSFLSSLGSSLRTRFKRSSDMTDIANAIEYHQKAVSITREGHSQMPSYLSELGRSYQSRFSRTGDLADIDEGIAHHEKAIFLAPEGHHEMPYFLRALSRGLWSRFRQTGNIDDISRDIELSQKAVFLTAEGCADLPVSLCNLGAAFRTRFERTGDLSDISNAIDCQQKSLLLSPQDDAYYAIYLGHLSTSFQVRFGRTGNLADLSSAIENLQQAVVLTPNDHPNQRAYLNNLAAALWARFGQTSDLPDLANAIEQRQKVVSLTPDGHPDMHVCLNHLGNSFRARFEKTAILEDISDAIVYNRKAIHLSPEGYTDIHMYLNGLGNSLRARFDLSSNLADITEAIENHYKAVLLTPKGHCRTTMYLNDLGASFRRRFDYNGNPADISHCINYQEQALIFTPEGHPDRSQYLQNLGDAFWSRFEKSGGMDDGQVALHNFCLAATQESGPPAKRLQGARRWVTCSTRLEKSEETLKAFGVALGIISLVVSLNQTIQTRHTKLGEISDLASEAVVFAIAIGQINTALEWLEQGRCLVWTQLNQLRTPVDLLRAFDAPLSDRFAIVSKALESSGSRTHSSWSTETSITKQIEVEDQVHAQIKLADEWSQLLTKIREIPKFHDFLQPPKATDIISQLPSDGPIIIINIHTTRCDALALLHGSVNTTHIPLNDFSYIKAESMRNGLRKLLASHGLRVRDDRAIRKVKIFEASNPLGEILLELWVNVVWPILAALGYSTPPTSRNHIRWCATGPLAFLPLHAAGIYGTETRTRGSCLSDFAVSSYIPTVSTLLEKLKRPSTTVAPRDTKILLISQPNTPGLEPIPATTKETQAIFDLTMKNKIEGVLLKDSEATIGRVKEEITSHGWVHLACHASQNPTDPLKSGFFLHDGQLELLEIVRQHLPAAEFAFLSACQTSVGDEKLSEEAVHLAAGMLAAGYQGVVATMWSIGDATAPEIAQDFYDYLLKDGKDEVTLRLDGRKAAYALDYAVQMIRDKLKGDDEAALLTWVPYIHFGL